MGGISLFSPADIGEVVWLKRPGNDWEGPYLVVDCSQRNHFYHTVATNQESVEVDFRTALRWGMVSGNLMNYRTNLYMIRDVEVWKGLQPPPDNSVPVNYSDWFLQRVEFDIFSTLNKVWDLSYANYRGFSDYKIALRELQLGIDN